MQSQAASNAELQRRLAQEEQDRRTQQAIDEALAKERAEKAATVQQKEHDPAQGSTGVHQTPPPYIVNQNLGPGTFFCSACGALAKSSDNFCSTCGRRHPKEAKEASNTMADAQGY